MPIQLLNDFNVKRLLEISSNYSFNELALQIFQFQSKNVAVYADYLSAIGCIPENIDRIEDIPFLPISFFKTHIVSQSPDNSEAQFKSSGTTSASTSTHYIQDLSFYAEIALAGFERRYGSLSKYSILGLLPSYLERKNSSLIYMVEEFMKHSNQKNNGFFLNDFDQLKISLQENNEKGLPTLLIGVTFALLDFVASHAFPFEELIVMETGGMKGRRKELTRLEVHEILKSGFGVSQVHSEYGMTELLSQAYSKGDGLFISPAWMKILIRDLNDPFSLVPKGKTGGINIIDLANIYSCSFIASEDLGRLHSNDMFEVLGRFDNSDIRGCNLMSL